MLTECEVSIYVFGAQRIKIERARAFGVHVQWPCAHQLAREDARLAIDKYMAAPVYHQSSFALVTHAVVLASAMHVCGPGLVFTIQP